jgi:hypothetical protein
MLANLVSTLVSDDVNVVVIDTGYEPPWGTYHGKVAVLRDVTQPPNISRWWNLGLDYVAKAQQLEATNPGGYSSLDDYVVAILNDDLVVPRKFVQKLAEGIIHTGAAAAYPDQHGFGRHHLHQYVGPISLYRRMTGYAFALRGSANIRADETLQWWYGDDDIDWTARQRGGSLLVGDLRVEHLNPNQTTVGELAEQTGRDRRQFEAKWGRTPW